MREKLGFCLQQIEFELRALRWWEEQAPDAAALASRQPFCVDTLAFSQWLQWVLLPRMQQLLDAQLPLPQNCAITAMAEVVYQDEVAQTRELCRALSELDALFAKNGQQA